MIVLVEQERKNKFSTSFNLTPFTIVRKKGSNLVVELKEGMQYSRNTSHYKKFQELIEDIDEIPRIGIDSDLPTTLKKVDIENTQAVKELEDPVQFDGECHEKEKVIW